MPNSELERIGIGAFNCSSIKMILIPPSVTEICDESFDQCECLQYVVFPENSQLKIIGQKAFSETAIRRIVIPKHVTTIRQDAFSQSDLEVVLFDQLSELQTIGKGAFARTVIKSILIPPHVTKISKYTFFGCDDLSLIEFRGPFCMEQFRDYGSARNANIMAPKFSDS